MQGYPLYMVAYIIGIILLIKRLKLMYHDTTQPWCTDDSEAMGMLDHLEKYFKALKFKG